MSVIFFSPAATASGLAPSSISNLFSSLTDFFSLTFEVINSSTSKSGFSASDFLIEISIPSISASVKPACFRTCFCASVNVKASLPSTTASSFSSEASSFCEVASVSSVAVFSFVVASLVASVAAFSAALLTTSLACSLSCSFSLITFSVVTASDCAVAVASTLLVFVVLAIELSADT